MLVTTRPGTHWEDRRQPLATVVYRELAQQTMQQRAEFYASVVELLVSKRVLSLDEVGGLLGLDMVAA